ncbi:hypothetical protein B488_07880 [Liberibacter crescens BT-1]|uniref:Uncharacterized protein n=1 Tax=Liberibacter crescens (strain BT-1) TaxID=1215343 RepID=L0EV99_LIBCB|nr:hypothetical protein B488_07880 [Liberibacter crescens BT-1]
MLRKILTFTKKRIYSFYDRKAQRTEDEAPITSRRGRFIKVLLVVGR